MPPDTRASAGPFSSAALARRVAAGDRLALEEAYRREASAVYRYALAFSGNPAWAADAVQEAFIAFARGAAAYEDARGSLGAYLAGAARHHLLAQWRLQRQEVSVDDDPAVTEDTDDAAASPETLLVQAQDGAALWTALRRLPLGQREAVVLVDLQERPYAEAAAIAGVEVNTLRTRLHRARSRLAAWLRPPADSAGARSPQEPA